MLVEDAESIKPKSDPRDYPDYTAADVKALRAVARGNGSSDQQIRAIEYIINTIACTYDINLRSSTNFTMAASGKSIVGKHLVWLLKHAETKK